MQQECVSLLGDRELDVSHRNGGWEKGQAAWGRLLEHPWTGSGEVSTKEKQETGHVRHRDVIMLGYVELCDAWCGLIRQLSALA